MVQVEQTSTGDPFAFIVTVGDGRGQTQHRVTLSARLHEQLTGGGSTPSDCVRAAFAFLLEREPKESILSHFDMSVISRYFPEFEREFDTYVRALD